MTNKNGSDKRRDSPEYWEARLARMGLSMHAGIPERWNPEEEEAERLLVYGHNVLELDFDGRNSVPVPPSDEELAEWPRSLV